MEQCLELPEDLSRIDKATRRDIRLRLTQRLAGRDGMMSSADLAAVDQIAAGIPKRYTAD